MNALRQSPSGKVLGQTGEFTAAIPATVGGTPAFVTSAPGVALVGGVVIGAGSPECDANQLFTIGSAVNPDGSVTVTLLPLLPATPAIPASVFRFLELVP